MHPIIEKHKSILVIAAIAAIILAFYLLGFSESKTEEGKFAAVNIEAEEPKAVEADTSENPALPEEDTSVFVDVKGEVKEPGLYEVRKGERLKFVIDKAGGFTPQADRNLINLAIKVTDEMLIYVPEIGEVVSAVPVIQGNQGSTEETKINLNEASEEEFESLPGIGPAKAATFVQYREENGPFTKIEDIKNISGIGDKTFEKLKEYIFVQ
ncbi:helix-hairpin-helix domain-containing protein [Bacillus sp. Marseille-Q1617]|uniref:helix-hairpin-helix domain-containing protein n=1 Tax=Bacillus sp. Marseille-Q1617 TaxID=2736887 RepID=UPI00158B8C95|nr:helix-hairpin-helix domain-containing protein [Bacillus sp. Marseille-Q1617]